MRSMVYAMFMASGNSSDAAFGEGRGRDEHGLNGSAGRHPIFMGCSRARR
jgi:hypothetical protein